MKRLVIALLLGTVLPAVAAPAEKQERIERKDRKVFRKAQEFFFFEEYDRAEPMLTKLITQYPNNAILHFQMGVCLYYSQTGKMSSMPWFEKAVALAGTAASEEMLYYAGTTYQMNNRFDDAIRCYQELRKKMETPDGIKSMNRLIETCENGKKLMSTPVAVRVENLGDNVNSPYPDYAPVFTSGDQLLLFTSKRKGTTGGNIDDEGHYFEDVYMSRNMSENGSWTSAGKLDTSYKMKRKGPLRYLFTKAENVSEINTHDHDGSIAVSPDGQKLYIYRYSDMWQATVNENGKWTRPKRMHEQIDGKSSHEPSMCISPDGNTMYFVSDRPGGIGGKDIYRAEKLANGNWGVPVNLGPNVNTPYDEESPFVSPDNLLLYFASEGHNSMGGFDVFKSPNENGQWMKPENLGYPINNGGDDLFFVPCTAGDRCGYYASMQHNTLGDLDIYAIAKIEQTHRMTVHVSDKNKGVSDARVWYTNTQNGRKNLLEFTPEGFALFNFEPGVTYDISLEREGYKPAKTSITMPAETRLDNCVQEITYNLVMTEMRGVSGQQIEIATALFDVDAAAGTNGDNVQRLGYVNTLDKVTPRKDLVLQFLTEIYPEVIAGNNTGNTVAFNTVYFEFEKADLNEEAKVELNRAAEYMNRNPNLRFEIYGYTDAKGSEQFNQELSARRAEAVKTYLLGKGVAPELLIVIPKGMSDPVSGNDDEVGRRKNRRVEIRIRK